MSFNPLPPMPPRPPFPRPHDKRPFYRRNPWGTIGLILVILAAVIIFADMLVFQSGWEYSLWLEIIVFITGIAFCIAGLTRSPRWMGAVGLGMGCFSGLIVAIVFIVVLFAAGQYKPPAYIEEDSTLVVDSIADDIINNLDSIR